MSDMKCPFCQQELRKIHPIYVICDNCRITGEDKLWQELTETKQELEQSETCCSEWEKQALDYKAENIALSGDLECTHKALDVAENALERIVSKCTKAKMTEINYGKVDGIESIARETIKQITETKEQIDEQQI